MRPETKENSMNNPLTLEEVDRDGAIQETMDRVSGDTRAAFLTKAAVATGGLVGGGALLGVLAGPASAATANDVAIANFALTLEYLEASFYAEAVSNGALSGKTATFAKVVAQHEAQHVAALKKMLGSAAIAKPSFNFKGTTEDQAKFEKTAMVLEDEGVAAYKGQAPRIDETAVLNAALAIHTVEAHHASWIRHILGVSPAPAAFDQPKTMQRVLADVKATGFIVAKPTMKMHGHSPGFTG
ncbi:MAG: ferritin-like domain-containing protein [Gaiellaceae bacterium]